MVGFLVGLFVGYLVGNIVGLAVAVVGRQVGLSEVFKFVSSPISVGIIPDISLSPVK